MRDEIWDLLVTGGQIYAVTRGGGGTENRMWCAWTGDAWKNITNTLVPETDQPNEVESFALLASLPERPPRRLLKKIGLVT